MRFSIQWEALGRSNTVHSDGQIDAGHAARALSKVFRCDAVVRQGTTEVVRYRCGELVLR